MQRFIADISKFSLLALCIYFVGVVIWTHFVPFKFLKKNTSYPVGSKGFMLSRIAELDSIKNVDVLFLGSSHAFRGFDPRVFHQHGFSSFNLGSASQTPLQTNYLLDAYLDQLNPGLIIYETYPATLENDGVEASLDFIANTSQQGAAFQMALQLNHLKTYNAFLYDTFFQAFDLHKKAQELMKKEDTYVQGGFVETAVASNKSPITAQIRKTWKDQWEIKDYQWKTFCEILAVLERKKIPILLVQMPVTTDAYSLYNNNDELDSLFSSTGNYFNFNHEPFLDDTNDFMDYHHLNQRGVDKTNQKLIQLLLKEYPSLLKKEHCEN